MKFLKGLIVGLLLAVSITGTAQLINGNHFPFWTVDGALTVGSSGSEVFSNLTASQAVVTDSNSNLSTVATSGTGSIARVTSPVFVTPTLGVASATSVSVTNFYKSTAPNTQTGSTYSVLATDNYIIANASGTLTLTLPDPTAAANTGRKLCVKTIAAHTVVSASSNVAPIDSATAGTAMLAATAGKWACAVADGTNWVIVEAN